MRLFVAVDLPATIKDELERAIGTLRPSLPDARWVPRDNLHLTLSFLGEVAEERVEDILDALRDARAPASPLSASLAGSGAFPSPRRARVLWAGLESDADALGSLARACGEALAPLGFAVEKRPWTAHLTLARLRVPADVSALLPLTLSPLGFEIDEVTLFRSRLARPAPHYEPVARVPLGR